MEHNVLVRSALENFQEKGTSEKVPCSSVFSLESVRWKSVFYSRGLAAIHGTLTGQWMKISPESSEIFW